MTIKKGSKSTIAADPNAEEPKARKGSQIETIRAAFANYDEDKSGAIDARELQNLVKDLGGVLHEDDLKKALKVLDKDQSGTIDQNEFIEWWTRNGDDLDGDGQLGDLEKALARLKEMGQNRFHVDIHTAAWNGHADVIERLIEDEPDVLNEKDTSEFGDSNTPLHYAAYQGHERVCEILLDHGANINVTNATGCTPLFFASQQSRAAVTKILLEKGADIRIAEKEHKFTCVDVCTCPEILDIFKSLSGSAPSAPGIPTLSESKDDQIKVTWIQPPFKLNEVAPVSGYKIKLSADGKPARVVLAPATSLETIVTGLTPATEYTAEVAAINIYGVSEYSEMSSSLSTWKGRPSAPTLTVLQTQSNAVRLSWPECPEDVVNYIIHSSVGNDEVWKPIMKVDGNTTEVLIEDLFSDRRYLFRVAGVNESGKGNFSTPVAAYTRNRESISSKLRQSKLKLSVVNAFALPEDGKRPQAKPSAAAVNIPKKPVVVEKPEAKEKKAMKKEEKKREQKKTSVDEKTPEVTAEAKLTVQIQVKKEPRADAKKRLTTETLRAPAKNEIESKEPQEIKENNNVSSSESKCGWMRKAVLSAAKEIQEKEEKELATTIDKPNEEERPVQKSINQVKRRERRTQEQENDEVPVEDDFQYYSDSDSD